MSSSGRNEAIFHYRMTTRNRLLIEMSVLILLLSVVQLLGIFQGAYAKFWWLDMPMHFLGGAFIGISAIWFYFYSGYWPFPPRQAKGRDFMFLAITATFIVAGVWELYEYVLGPFFTYSSYKLDTTKDIILGMLGSVAGSAYFVNTKLKGR
ncbi:MAG: hypothetical protein HYV68_01145 [Candidatus Taylorbacteria bacterium]|nr:hypothetical protein [Candidatus Taylorbacteria bacterium]